MTTDARVARLLDEVDLPADPAIDVRIHGADPVLPTPFRAGELAAVALGACGAAAALISAGHTGTGQSIDVDVRRATASLLGFWYQHLDGGPPEPRPHRALVDLYRCRDRQWIHLHGGFPDLAARTLAVLDLPETSEAAAVAAAVARWNSGALEDALAEAKTCGAVVRTVDEWATHPQGAAMGTRARVEIERIGDSDAEAVGTVSRPLGGTRVLDLTRVLAAPTHGRVLAEHGADVLLVNSPRLPNVTSFVMDTSHGKLSAHLDLDAASDVAVLRELIAGSDVFAQNYRAGALARRGFGLEELVHIRPGIIVVDISCYGHVGPWHDRAGWEQLAQSVSGIATRHGTQEHPALIPAAPTDYTTGYLAALGTMTALRRRAEHGGSYHVRASLVQTAMALTREPFVDPGGAGGVGNVDGFSTTTATPWGTLRHLRPVTEMSATPPRWDRPSAPPGTHPAAWPASTL